MPTAASKPKTSPHHRKRTGNHHTRSRQYIKTYWPYVPIALIIALGLFLGNWQPQTKNGVLAYATQMSISGLLDTTNQQRIAKGTTELRVNDALTAAAQAKANDMTVRNYWSHTTPDGKEPWVFVQTAGYDYQKAGENLAYGFDSGKDTVTGWMKSPTHRQNMLDPQYTEVGFGFANARDFNGSGPETVVVAMYGRPTSAPAIAATAPTVTPAPVTSVSAISPEPSTLGVSRLHVLTDGRLPWATFALGILSGAALVLFVVRHGFAVRRLVTQGEAFIVHHPFLDIALVSLVMVGYVLSQTSGVIR